MLFLGKTYVLDFYENRLAEAIVTNTQNVLFIKELLKNIRYSCFRRVHIRFLYKSEFDFTAKSMIINAVDVTRVLCTSVERNLLKLCLSHMRKFSSILVVSHIFIT